MRIEKSLRMFLLLFIALLFGSVSFVSAYGGGGSGLILSLPQNNDNLMFRQHVSTVSDYTFLCNHFALGYRFDNRLFINYVCPNDYAVRYFSIDYVAGGFSVDSVDDDLEIYSFAVDGKNFHGRLITNAFLIKTAVDFVTVDFNVDDSHRFYTGDSLKRLYRTYNNRFKKYVIVTEK